MNKYSFLERGRNQIKDTLKDNISLSLEAFQNFKPVYTEFITQMKSDDEDHGDSEQLFLDNGYPSFEDLIKNEQGEFLKDIISDFLFVEFFECFFSNQSDLLITQLLSITFSKSSLLLEIGYITRK